MGTHGRARVAAGSPPGGVRAGECGQGVNPPESWRVPLSGLALPGFGHESFVVDGRHAVAGAVPAAQVVEVDDPGGDLESGLGAGGEPVAVDVLDLDGGVEGFGGGV